MYMASVSNLKSVMNKYILHIETATKVCSVAISNHGQLIACKESHADGYIHSEALTLYIEEVLFMAKIEITQLAAVSFSSGPGSYTGLRIGLSTAKGICFALAIPLIAIDTLDALHAQINSMDKTIIPMLDARRMEVYAQVYAANGEILQELDSLILDETSFQSFEPFIVLGDGAEKCKEIWKNRAIEWRDDVRCSATGQVTLAYQKFALKKFEDLAYFTPIYLKDANGVRR